MTRTIIPVFFAKTRSFWLGIVPGALTAVDVAFQVLGSADGGPVADALAMVLSAFGADVTGEAIATTMQRLAPLYLLIFAQQRGTFSGKLPRPYTADPKVERAVVEAVENGKSAFEAGKRLGKALKR